MDMIDIMRSSNPKAKRNYPETEVSTIDWHELVNEVKSKSGLSYNELALELGLKSEFLRHIVSGKCGISYQPKFDAGLVLVMYSKEIGADIDLAIGGRV